MSDHRKKLDAYIQDSDKRVDTWSTARKESFQNVVERIRTDQSTQQKSPKPGQTQS